MASFEYCASIRCDKTGIWLFDIECDVEIEHERGRGFEITGVSVMDEDAKPVSLADGDALAQKIYGIVVAQVDAELGNSRGQFFAKVTDHFNDEYASYWPDAGRADFEYDRMREGA